MQIHRSFVADNKAQQAYEKALKKTLPANGTVLDLGTGTGIHSLFACKAGAKNIYAIDPDDVILKAQEIIRQNGFADRVQFIQSHSSQVQLPEKVDIIISNQGFPTLLRYLPEARLRFLKQHGHIIPYATDLFFVPITQPQAYREEISYWRSNPHGFDFSAMENYAVNEPHYLGLHPSCFLAKPQKACSVDFRKPLPQNLRWELRFKVSQPKIFHGFGHWFDYRLAPGVKISTKPPTVIKSDVWKNIFFAIRNPIKVQKNDRIEVEIGLLLYRGGILWNWKGHVLRKKQTEWKTIHTFEHSRFYNVLLSKEKLHRSSPEAKLEANIRGLAAKDVLEAFSSTSEHRLTTAEIENNLWRKFPKEFPNLETASEFVADLIGQYVKDTDFLEN